MRLKTILPYIDFLTKVRLYENISTVKEDWEIVFEGYVMDIPWVYMEHCLITEDKNEGSEAICPYIDEKGEACLRITLVEK